MRRVVEAEVLYERAALCRDRAAAAQAQQRPPPRSRKSVRSVQSRVWRRGRLSSRTASSACYVSKWVRWLTRAELPIQEAELQNWASEDGGWDTDWLLVRAGAPFCLVANSGEKNRKCCCSSMLLEHDRRMSRLLTPTLLRRCGSGRW